MTSSDSSKPASSKRSCNIPRRGILHDRLLDAGFELSDDVIDQNRPSHIRLAVEGFDPNQLSSCSLWPPRVNQKRSELSFAGTKENALSLSLYQNERQIGRSRYFCLAKQLCEFAE